MGIQSGTLWGKPGVLNASAPLMEMNTWDIGFGVGSLLLGCKGSHLVQYITGLQGYTADQRWSSMNAFVIFSPTEYIESRLRDAESYSVGQKIW